MDLTKRISQAKFAQLVGITQPAVSGLISRGILQVRDTGENWVIAYCGHLRDIASGRTGSNAEGFDPDKELGRLRAAQADKVEMANLERRAELAPVSVIEEVLVRSGVKVASLLDAIPSSIKRRVPSLTDAEIGFIRREIAHARNAVANLSLEDIEGEETEE
ncbi:terminase small subunit [Paenalcaligenes suwonensis]|uniref:terminase small subunit n=1 Tax=Paenalcaligenes suwonensis TaxID=1202713 RepID=UPI001F604613|nr:terminase small subunit [Paenalcaligenes suwonensis]